jgi:hypothetical protein
VSAAAERVARLGQRDWTIEPPPGAWRQPGQESLDDRLDLHDLIAGR